MVSIILFILIGIKLDMGILFWILVYIKSIADVLKLFGSTGDVE